MHTAGRRRLSTLVIETVNPTFAGFDEKLTKVKGIVIFCVGTELVASY